MSRIAIVETSACIQTVTGEIRSPTFYLAVRLLGWNVSADGRFVDVPLTASWLVARAE
jgi:hypothetical protein